MSGIWIGVRGELLNSKSEWHQAKVVRTRTKDVQGGVELVQHQAVGGSQGESRGRTLGWGVGARTQGQWDSFSKSKSSIVVLSHPFCFWQGTGHNPVFQNFCQLKWPGQQGSLDLFRKCIRFRGTTLFLRQSLLNSIFHQGKLYFRQSLLKAIFTRGNLYLMQSLLKAIFTQGSHYLRQSLLNAIFTQGNRYSRKSLLQWQLVDNSFLGVLLGLCIWKWDLFVSCLRTSFVLISELKGNCQYKKWSCFLQENPGERWKGKWVSKYFLSWQNPISPLTKETRLALRLYSLSSMSEPYLALKIRLHTHVYTQGHSANVYSKGSFVSGNILDL